MRTRDAIQDFSEMKIAIIREAQDVAKKVITKSANIQNLVSRRSFKAEYSKLVDMIVATIIKRGIISDLLELANGFWTEITAEKANG